MNYAIQEKVYRITYGVVELIKKPRRKVPEANDSLCIDSVTIVATDVYDALSKTAGYLLAIEKDYAKDDLMPFVQEVELVTLLDDVSTKK